MNRKQCPGSIWEMDPACEDEIDLDDYTRLFLAAFERRFHSRAHPEEVQIYLNRYLSYRVIPPWLRDYLVRTFGDEDPYLMANAPIDPSFDWRVAEWPIFALILWLQQRCEPPVPKGPLLPA